MKKILSLLVVLSLTVLSSFAADIRFIQVDGVKYNPNAEDSVTMLDNLIKSINNQKDVSFVIFSGNNIARPDKEFLVDFMKKVKKINSPVYIALGNKELNKKRGLGKEVYIKTYRKYNHLRKNVKTPNYVINKGNVVFIVPDGSKEFLATANGYYRADTMKWLSAKLKKYSKKNIIILQHFPIVPPSDKDGYQTYKADEYLELIESMPNVKAVISGHYGVNSEITKDGILHISTQSAPKYRIIDVIDTETKNPVIWSSVKE